MQTIGLWNSYPVWNHKQNNNNMYTNQPNCQTPENIKQTEFLSIVNRLENESSRFFNLVNELLRKADSIQRLPDEKTEPNCVSPEPVDFVSKAYYEINQISRQNDKLQKLVDHFNQLV